jgi:hypothetical protein
MCGARKISEQKGCEWLPVKRIHGLLMFNGYFSTIFAGLDTVLSRKYASMYELFFNGLVLL